jgi:hypothetical protein
MPKTEKSGVTGNRVILGLRNVTVVRQLKADHPLKVKVAKPKIYETNTEVKQRMAWVREEIREVTWCYTCMHCRKYLTDNYKKAYEI